MSVVATPSALRSSSLIVRTATQKAEIDHLRAVLNQGHYLKAGRPAGHILWQGIYLSDAESGLPELVAVFCWGGAAKRLRERDNHIGWVGCRNLCQSPQTHRATTPVLRA